MVRYIYLIILLPDKRMSESFKLEGVSYQLASNWFENLPVNKETPLKYLEIGAFYGANLISVAQTYGAHADSELHCIDPWCDYEEYPEYKGTIESVYDVFKRNNKITIMSHLCV